MAHGPKRLTAIRGGTTVFGSDVISSWKKERRELGITSNLRFQSVAVGVHNIYIFIKFARMFFFWNHTNFIDTLFIVLKYFPITVPYNSVIRLCYIYRDFGYKHGATVAVVGVLTSLFSDT